jgi:hemerythrin-like domain-containing protein
MSDDAIVLLREDHKELRRDLKEFKRTGQVDTARRGELRDRVVQLWSDHLEADNGVLYPAVRDRIPHLLDEALTVGERNELIERLVTDLGTLEPYDERLAAKMQVLTELTELHVDHEEQVLFPRVREEWGRNDLQSLGRQIRSDRNDARAEPDDPVSSLLNSFRK